MAAEFSASARWVPTPPVSPRPFRSGLFLAFLLLLLSPCLLAAPAPLSAAVTAPQWTPEESAWLRDNPQITVAINHAWPPMDFLAEDGTPQGIGVDFIAALNQRLDDRLRIVPGPWEEIYERVKTGDLDALVDITPRPSREPHFNFTTPYIKVPHAFISREDAPYILSLEDLRGKSLAVEEGFYLNSILERDYPDIEVRNYATTSDALHAVARGDCDAYAGNRAVATYIIHTELFSNLEVHGKLRESASINAIGVRKNAPLLARILQKALDDISLRERLAILERWTLGNDILSPSDLDLSDAQWQWLDDHPTIRLAGDPSFPPIEFSDRDGHTLGIATEYLDIIAETLGINFVYQQNDSWQEALGAVRQRRADMFAAAANTTERRQYARFTDPYLNIPVMIFSRGDSPIASGLPHFSGKRLAVVEGYAVQEMLARDNWGVELVSVPDIVSGLEAVREGGVDGFVGNILSTSYFIRQHHFVDLQIASHTPYQLELAMGVRSDWPQLVPILNRALKQISVPEQEQIAARWIGVRVQEQPNYRLFWQALAAALLLLVLILVWNLQLRRRIALHTSQIRAQNRDLQRSQRELTAAQRIARLGSWSWNLTSGEFRASTTLKRILGCGPGHQLRSLDDIQRRIHPDDRDAAREAVESGIANGTKFEVEYRILGPTDNAIFVHEHGEVSVDRSACTVVSSTVQDVSERRLAESTIYKLQQVFDKNPCAVIVTDLENRIEYANQAFARNTGHDPEAVLGCDLLSLLTPDNLHSDYQHILESARRGQVWKGEMLSYRRDGTPFWEDVTIAPVVDREGRVANLLELRQDLSGQKAMEERLLHCPLTRLPNQAQALQRMRQAQELQQEYSLLFVDLLHLKRINDSLGFDAGDLLIIQTARRLGEAIKDPDTIAHLGGGQYLVKLNTVSDLALEHQIQSVLSAFKRPFFVSDEQINQGICIGAVKSDGDTSDPGDLLTRAHIAANQAKRDTPHNWSFYSAEYNQATQNQFHMENLLAQALENEELFVAFQPKYDVHSRCFTGAEALMRWYNDELGLVAPHQFIPMAENNDLIIPMGHWIIRESVRQAADCRRLGYVNFSISINLSPRQFLDDALVDCVHNCLAAYGVDSNCLELELTESLLIENTEQVIRKMHQLKNLGIKLLLDDFGTGFSSLSYLQKFPFDGLKIDRSFIYDYPSFQGNVGLIKAIIAMGKALHMAIIAEGVESQEQAEFLLSEDCSVFQGYLYSKPLPGEDFNDWLRELNKQQG